MSNVKNKKVIHRIADQTRKASKGRNIVSILAITLTTLLFTALFTVGGSIISKQQEATMRQVGGSSHGGYKYLTQAEYDILKKDHKIKDLSYRITVGNVVNDSLNKLHTEVSYYEDLNARQSFCYPETGEMPEKENEIVTSDLVLDALGVEEKLGETITLTMDVGGKIVEEEFVISGIYEGDTMSNAQIVAVSKDYQEKIAPVKTDSLAETGPVTEQDYVGRIMADFNFGNSFFLEKQLSDLTARCGFPESIATGINWAYLGGELDVEVVFLLAVLLLVILLSGYLIIYNIFYINVFSEIRHYGLFKTVGTTGRQLKKIVRRQVYMLSLVGIPIGILFGMILGKIILPLIMGTFSFSNTTNTDVELNPWIFIGAAAFSFLTVYLSCIKPCRIAANVTPIEALRFSEVSHETEEKVQTGKLNHLENRRQSKKKTKKVTTIQLAIQNMKRTPKKVIVVVSSLSLALLILNSIYSLILGFDMDKYVSTMTVSDFSVSDATLDNVTIDRTGKVIDGVTEEFLIQLSEQKGVEEIENIYLCEQNDFLSFTDEDWEKIQTRIFENERIYQELIEVHTGIQGVTAEEYLDYLIADKSLDGEMYGIGKSVLEILENVEGELDWEKFKTGNYVITGRYGFDEENRENYFYPGETITLFNSSGKSRQYEVLAVADMPYVCGLQVYGTFNCNYILPDTEFLEFFGRTQPMRTLINVEEPYEAEIEAWISNFCSQTDPNLDYTSKSTIMEEFDSMIYMYGVVGDLLAFILAFIGILNFINTMVSSILFRKQELAMMEAVGMSPKQQIQMLMWEGIVYAVLTFAAALILGAFLNAVVIRKIGEVFFFFQWHFTLMPIVWCILPILFVVVVVPLRCYANMRKVSVVERIRGVE